MTTAARRRLARKSERGTTVLIVSMIVTLVTAIGILAVRSASQLNTAVGYGRLSGQTTALAELGTSAAIAEFGAGKAAAYVAKMDAQPEQCIANTPLFIATAPCARLFRSDLEASTQAYSSTKLLQATDVPSDETGSFGLGSATVGDVMIEVTEKGPTGKPVAGSDLTMQFAKVTLTSTAQVRPTAPTGINDDTCNAGVAKTTSKKVMRARVVVGPI